jgi:hypothetical protein
MREVKPNKLEKILHKRKITTVLLKSQDYEMIMVLYKKRFP